MTNRPTVPLALLLIFGPLGPGLAARAGTQPATRATMTEADANPLLSESRLPLRYSPFDRIRSEHYAPAFERGMAERLGEVGRIAESAAEPSFENTIVALERSGETLARVFFGQNSAHTNPEMLAMQREMAPELAAHRDKVTLDPRLWARIQALYEKRDALGLAPQVEVGLPIAHRPQAVEVSVRGSTRAGVRHSSGVTLPDEAGAGRDGRQHRARLSEASAIRGPAGHEERQPLIDENRQLLSESVTLDGRGGSRGHPGCAASRGEGRQRCYTPARSSLHVRNHGPAGQAGP